VTLPVGADRQLVVRPVRSDDQAALSVLYDGIDEHDRRPRFFCVYRPQLEWFADLAAADQHGGARVVAELTSPDGSELVGEAGYLRLPNGNGELALLVAGAGLRGPRGPWRLANAVAPDDDAVGSASVHGLSSCGGCDSGVQCRDGGWITTVGHAARPLTACDTDPNRAARTRLRPRVPRTMRSASRERATSSVVVLPSTSTSSTGPRRRSRARRAAASSSSDASTRVMSRAVGEASSVVYA
jgi:hypothetical protein